MNEYRTSDVVLAAALRVHGVKLERIEKDPQSLRRGVFIFSNVTEEILLEFDAGDMRVEPSAFNQQIRVLTTAVKRLLENHV